MKPSFQTTKHTRFWSVLIVFLLLPVLVLMEKNVVMKTTEEPQPLLAREPLPLPTPYPMSFSIEFSTNLTDTTDIDIDSNDETRRGPIAGKLFYDWSIQKQRIDHGPGSYECQHFYNTSKARCSLIFVNPIGMYRLLLLDDEQQQDDNEPDAVPAAAAAAAECCLDLPAVGTPSPNWAQQANGTFNGAHLDLVSHQWAFQWTFDHLSPPPILSRSAASMNHSFHTMREVAFSKDNSYSGRPLTFTFPGPANGRQDYHFNVQTMIVGPHHNASALFHIPHDCILRPCQQTTAAGVIEEVLDRSRIELE
jgi:hypothetical protein